MRGSVNSLTRYHAPHAASRVFYIPLTAWNWVYVSVRDSLPPGFSAIHPQIKATHHIIFFPDIDPNLIEQLIDSSPLWLEQIEES